MRTILLLTLCTFLSTQIITTVEYNSLHTINVVHFYIKNKNTHILHKTKGKQK